MNKITEQIEQSSFKSYSFQIQSTIIASLLWAFADVLLVILPLIELNSEVVYFDSSGLEFNSNVLDYDICKTKWTVIKKQNHSLTQFYDTECDETLTSLIASSFFVGYMLVSYVFSLFIDSFGRKKSYLMITFVTSAVFMLFASISNFYVLLFFMVLTGFCAGFCTNVSIVYLTEIVPLKYRSITVGLLNAGYVVCGLIFVPTLYFSDSFSVGLLGAGAGILAIAIANLFVLEESPKYYLIKGEWQNYILSVRRIANKNSALKGFDESVNYPDCLYLYEGTVLEEEKQEEMLNSSLSSIEGNKEIDLGLLTNLLQKPKKEETVSMLSFFRYSSQTYNFLLTCWCYFVLAGVYYGFSIYIKRLPGNVYTNALLIYVLEFFAYLVLSQIASLSLFGRKYSLIVFMLIAAATFFLLHIRLFEGTIELVIAMTCRTCISAAYNVIITYSLELFPIRLRSTAYGFNNITSRIAGIVTPFIIEMLPNNSNLVYSGALLSAVMMMFFGEETLGKAISAEIPEETTGK